MESIRLFEYRDDFIRITVDACFREDCLVIEGYDIGKKVTEYWGDSDYEYEIKIFPEGVGFLFTHFSVDPRDRIGLLGEIKNRYHSNTCFSEIQALLEKHGVKYESFSWR